MASTKVFFLITYIFRQILLDWEDNLYTVRRPIGPLLTKIENSSIKSWILVEDGLEFGTLSISSCFNFFTNNFSSSFPKSSFITVPASFYALSQTDLKGFWVISEIPLSMYQIPTVRFRSTTKWPRICFFDIPLSDALYAVKICITKFLKGFIYSSKSVNSLSFYRATFPFL